MPCVVGPCPDDEDAHTIELMRTEIDTVTRLLCIACAELDGGNDGVSDRELRAWHSKHLEDDRRREGMQARETARKKQQRRKGLILDIGSAETKLVKDRKELEDMNAALDLPF